MRIYKKVIVFLALSLFVMSCKPVFYKYNSFSNCYSELNELNSYKLIILGSFSCGYSRVALEDLKQIPQDNNLKIIYIEYAVEREENINKIQKYYPNYLFIKKKKCDNIKEISVFPQFYLFDNSGKLVWRKYKLPKQIQMNTYIKI